MERLTIRNNNGRARLELHREKGRWSVSTNWNPITVTGDAIDRLAAYEDTGLEPEEAKALKAYVDRKAVAMITEINGVPIDRVLELTEAEQDGRLVVLPCKVGSVVYAAETSPVIPLHVIAPAVYLDAVYPDDAEDGDFEMLDNFGKTVFLTREEAERALEGGQSI